MNVSDYQAYHKIITSSYDERSKSYGQSNWHRSLAVQLVDYHPPQEGDSVLDIATGTGSAAYHCSGLVGRSGRVFGIDLSQGMISEAEKLKEVSLHDNLTFKVMDSEALDFPENSFDRIYCASAFFWIADKPRALANWRRMLKPGGLLGFHAWPETSFVCGCIARRVLKNHGIEYLANSPTGSMAICEALLRDSGYSEVEIKEVKDGHFMSLEEAKDGWISEEDYPIGQYPHPITAVPQEILEKAKLEYFAEMDKLAVEEGVWNDITTYYVYGVK
ncbi:MAG: class I SAM-dependent methyltransferase [Gammaproteobacteria bacterium]|nr:class I SAM-dependent methyltransferase [Gammaproteobacteria bacterium]